MTAAVTLAVACLAVAESDRIAEFSAAGVTVKMKAIIDEARTTIDQLRAVAKIAAKANLSLVARAGRWGGFTHDEKVRAREQTVAALRQLEVPPVELDAMLEEWRQVAKFDYVFFLLGQHHVPKQVQGVPDLHKEWKGLRDRHFDQVASADAVEDFLRRAGMLDPEAVELLADLRHYEQHGEHRRPAVWKALEDSTR